MAATLLDVQGLEIRYGDRLVQRGVSFGVERGTIFAVMGGSGCGKSSLLKCLIGLLEPAAGHVLYDGVDYWASDEAARNRLRAGFGMLFQSAALWSSMSLMENVCLPLELHTRLDAAQREHRAREVLGWVGLAEFAAYMPADLSGGMKKRAGLARAIAAEAPLLYLDEPSAGLDPVSSLRLDELIVSLRDRTGAAIVLVSHELPSLLAICDDGIFLDGDSHAPVARGAPRTLYEESSHPVVRAFLHREEPLTRPAPARARTERASSAADEGPS